MTYWTREKRNTKRTGHVTMVEYIFTSDKEYDGSRLFDEMCEDVPSAHALTLDPGETVTVTALPPHNPVDRKSLLRVMRLHKA